MTGLAGRHLLLIGPGYAARAVAMAAMAEGARVSAVIRDPGRADGLASGGIGVVALPPAGAIRADQIAEVTDILVSAPPGLGGCPALAALGGRLPPRAGWIGYYSSTAVYGDCGGAWIDETRAPAPKGADAQARLIAEMQWRAAAGQAGAALDLLRIAGIYGPDGRNVLGQLASGKARAIIKPGQVFNRIHRDDIAGATLAAMRSPAAAPRLTNLADGAPSPASEVLMGVAAMLDLPAPPEVALADAGLPPGAAGFYAENRRIRNDRLLALPGFVLRFADWQAGYRAIIAGRA